VDVSYLLSSLEPNKNKYGTFLLATGSMGGCFFCLWFRGSSDGVTGTPSNVYLFSIQNSRETRNLFPRSSKPDGQPVVPGNKQTKKQQQQHYIH
jgi:hypothetical protein